jgi:hypothetical protein
MPRCGPRQPRWRGLVPCHCFMGRGARGWGWRRREADWCVCARWTPPPPPLPPVGVCRASEPPAFRVAPPPFPAPPRSSPCSVRRPHRARSTGSSATSLLARSGGASPRLWTPRSCERGAGACGADPAWLAVSPLRCAGGGGPARGRALGARSRRLESWLAAPRAGPVVVRAFCRESCATKCMRACALELLMLVAQCNAGFSWTYARLNT